VGYRAALFAVILHFAILVEHRRVTDTHRHNQTDRRTATAYTEQA